MTPIAWFDQKVNLGYAAWRHAVCPGPAARHSHTRHLGSRITTSR